MPLSKIPPLVREQMRRERGEVPPPSRPALVVADNRSGGTFMMYSLSVHPEIFATRHEPFCMTSWRAASGMDERQVIHTLTTIPQFRVGIFKVTHKQFMDSGHLHSFFVERPSGKVIHLWRENVFRQAMSYVASTGIRFTEQTELPMVECVPAEVLNFIRAKVTERERVRNRIAGMVGAENMLCIKYENMIGGEGGEAGEISPDIAACICRFLGVTVLPLSNPGMRTTTPFKARRFVANYAELERVISGSEFAYFLEREELYR